MAPSIFFLYWVKIISNPHTDVLVLPPVAAWISLLAFFFFFFFLTKQFQFIFFKIPWHYWKNILNEVTTMEDLEIWVLKSFADESSICHRPQEEEGGTTSSVFGRAGSGEPWPLPLEKPRQSAWGNQRERAASVALCLPSNLTLRNRGWKETQSFPGLLSLTALDLSSLYLFRAESLGLCRWPRQRCFQWIKGCETWEPKKGQSLHLLFPTLHYRMELWSANSPLKVPPAIHRPGPGSSRIPSAFSPLWCSPSPSPLPLLLWALFCSLQ